MLSSSWTAQTWLDLFGRSQNLKHLRSVGTEISYLPRALVMPVIPREQLTGNEYLAMLRDNLLFPKLSSLTIENALHEVREPFDRCLRELLVPALFARKRLGAPLQSFMVNGPIAAETISILARANSAIKRHGYGGDRTSDRGGSSGEENVTSTELYYDDRYIFDEDALLP
ncbi:hypothetical protein EW146_g7689 [Bondarzewia mesenterica]|uniref:Uncharacterized protein n=1 Tax=Bondarzewia mesenterica TaxID=1095465 RepID=A0A4S4LKN9_9AGAM|nr:hypothetical protein EW146_g7689 [Bondarzewia mesenterica]